MNIEKVFYSFCEKLKEREGFLSEDNVRFYWFAAMLEQDSNLNHFSLEEPYSNLKGKELDLMYYNEKQDLMCFEIKFHINRTAETTFPHTQAAGELFDDLLRLTALKNKDIKNWEKGEYFFLYVNDNEMHDYLSMVSNQNKNLEYREELKSFYDGTKLDLYFNQNTPKAFRETANESTKSNSEDAIIINGLTLLYKASFHCESLSQDNENCHVRLYEL